MLLINVNINLHGTVKMSEAVTDVTSCIVLLIFFRLVQIKRIRQSVYLSPDMSAGHSSNFTVFSQPVVFTRFKVSRVFTNVHKNIVPYIYVLGDSILV